MIARRLAVSCAANSLAATLIAFASYALATDVSFVGNVSYATAGNVAVLSADQVQNTDAYGMSGTLHMELWALSAPYGGSAITGYKLAQYSLGSLMAGRALANIVSPNVS